MILKKNRRADRMWGYIAPVVSAYTRNVDEPFKDLSVIDLGIGYGDFMLRALQDGAGFVCGAEINQANINHTNNLISRERIHKDKYKIYEVDLSVKSQQVLLFQNGYDIGFCFSVLPYLDFPDDLLYMMSRHCSLSFIECQYKGDGPGLSYIRDDEDMQRWLDRYWEHAKPIGLTSVDIRPAYRTIWVCGVPKVEKYG